MVSDLRLVTSAVDRSYAGMIAYVTLKDVRDLDTRAKHVQQHVRHWREATYRVWQDGGPVFAPDESSVDE